MRSATPLALLDRVVAEVDSEVITARDLDFWMWHERLHRPETEALDDSSLAPEILRNLTDEILMAHWAAEKIKEIDDQEIDRAAEQDLNAFRQAAPSRNRFTDWLNEAGFDLDSLRQRVRDREKRLWLIRNALALIHAVRPERLEGSERTREEEAQRPVRVRIRQILLQCPARAEDRESSRVLIRALAVRREVVEGLPFSEAAELYSDDRATREAGGFVGWVEVSALHSALREAVCGIKRGDISLPVRSNQGWHLIQLLDSETPATLQVMQQVRKAYREILEEQRQERTIRVTEGYTLATPVPPDEPAYDDLR